MLNKLTILEYKCQIAGCWLASRSAVEDTWDDGLQGGFYLYLYMLPGDKGAEPVKENLLACWYNDGTTSCKTNIVLGCILVNKDAVVTSGDGRSAQTAYVLGTT